MRAAVNNTELFYAIQGSGRATPPLILMHGPGFDHTFFRPWLDRIAKDRQVVYFDSRGCGRSSREDVHAATIQTLVSDIDALRNHLTFDRFILYGHSFAGVIALDYAVKHSDQLAGLILDSTAPAFDYQPVMMANLAARATEQQQQRLMEAFTGQLKDDGDLRSAWELVLPVYFTRYDARIGAGMVESMQFSVAAFNHFSGLLLSMNLVPQLQGITTPTLILAGRHDWVCPPREGAERLHDGLQNSRLVVFEGSGHFAFIEERDAYLRTVDAWLSTIN